MPIDAAQFRAALALRAGGVAIVTARAGERVHGMTVTDFAGVSLEPPLVLVCADKLSNTLPVIESGRNFAVNLLANGQEALSNRFASKQHEWTRFEGLACEDGCHGRAVHPRRAGEPSVLGRRDARRRRSRDRGRAGGGSPLRRGEPARALQRRISPAGVGLLMERVQLVVYSDYLCPWCYLAEHRLGLLQRELGDALALEWRSFLLRPRPEPGRELEKFVRYTQSWLRPAAEPDAPVFRVWESTEGPPTHSVPAHLVAKAAAALGAEAFAEVHARLLRAYFEESRDISRVDTLRAVWTEAGLPEAGFAACLEEDTLVQQTLEQHNEAVSLGITGVPAVRVAGTDAFVLGAQPLATYRRWIERLRAGVLDEASS